MNLRAEETGNVFECSTRYFRWLWWVPKRGECVPAPSLFKSGRSLCGGANAHASTHGCYIASTSFHELQQFEELSSVG
jgi:hypothetical protein